MFLWFVQMLPAYIISLDETPPTETSSVMTLHKHNVKWAGPAGETLFHNQEVKVEARKGSWCLLLGHEGPDSKPDKLDLIPGPD